MSETTVHAFPLSALPSREATLAGMEIMTPADVQSIVTRVYINETAREWLPDALRYLASEEYFLRNIQMSIPLEQGTRRVLVPRLSGRVMPLAAGVIPFGDPRTGMHLGRIVTGKGSSFTGGNARDEYANNGVITNNIHLGLQSYTDSDVDTKISNALLAHKFRSALHLGYVTFDDARLRTWLDARWSSPKQQAVLDDSFAKVAIHGGSAYLFRVAGSLERVLDAYGAHHRKTVEIRQSSRLLLAELQMEHSSLTPILSRVGRPDDAVAALTLMEKGRQIDASRFEAYMDFVLGIFAHNIACLPDAEKNLGLSLSRANLSQAKDVDLGFFTCDFDEAVNYGTNGAAVYGAEDDESYLGGYAKGDLYTIFEQVVRGFMSGSEAPDVNSNAFNDLMVARITFLYRAMADAVPA